MSQENPLPPLPKPAMEDVDYELWGQNAVHDALFTERQMRSYAESARAQVLEVLRELVESHDEDDVDSDDKTISGAEFVRRLDAAMTRRKAAWAAARAVSKE